MCRENFTRPSPKFIDTSPELIIRRIKGSLGVSRKFYLTKSKISRHVSRVHNSSNKGVSRCVEIILPDQVQNFSTRLRSSQFVELRGLQTCRENFTRPSPKFLDTSTELIIRRIKGSPNVSKKFYLTKSKISRHFSGDHNSSN